MIVHNVKSVQGAIVAAHPASTPIQRDPFDAYEIIEHGLFLLHGHFALV